MRSRWVFADLCPLGIGAGTCRRRTLGRCVACRGSQQADRPVSKSQRRLKASGIFPIVVGGGLIVYGATRTEPEPEPFLRVWILGRLRYLERRNIRQRSCPRRRGRPDGDPFEKKARPTTHHRASRQARDPAHPDRLTLEGSVGWRILGWSRGPANVVRPASLVRYEGGTMKSSSLVVVSTFHSAVEAQIAKDLLDETGIVSKIRADNAGGMYPGIAGRNCSSGPKTFARPRKH